MSIHRPKHRVEQSGSDRLAEAVYLLGRQMSRRGFLGVVTKGAVVVTGAAAGLFKFGGTLGTDIRDAFACWICASEYGTCECFTIAPSICFATDGTYKLCWKDEYPQYDCVRAICAPTVTSVWICPKFCTWCAACPIAC
jgi:hypothetical protein